MQDNVIVHALSDSTVHINVGSAFPHGHIVHGPCVIGKGCFIGFGSIVFDGTLMDGCVVLHRALITNSKIHRSRLSTKGAIIDGVLDGTDLKEVSGRYRRVANSVREVNIEPSSMYGRSRPAELIRIIGGR